MSRVHLQGGPAAGTRIEDGPLRRTMQFDGSRYEFTRWIHMDEPDNEQALYVHRDIIGHALSVIQEEVDL